MAPVSGVTRREWQDAMMHRLISAHVAEVGSAIAVMVLEEGTSSMSMSVGWGIGDEDAGLTDSSDESVAHPSPSLALEVGHPTTPLSTILSTVSVPVLSKHSTSSLPANGMRNGSVQNTSPLLSAAREFVTVTGGVSDGEYQCWQRLSLV